MGGGGQKPTRTHSAVSQPTAPRTLVELHYLFFTADQICPVNNCNESLWLTGSNDNHVYVATSQERQNQHLCTQ